MFPFIYRRQTVQAQPGPRRGHTQTGSGRRRAVLPIEDGGVLISRRAAGRPGGWAGGWMDRQTGLEARCRALLNVGVKGAIKLPLLIVHLTQDHVVLQEEFVSHTKSGKSKQENEAMVGSQWMVGAPGRTPPSPGGGHVGSEVLGVCALSFPERILGSPKQTWPVTPAQPRPQASSARSLRGWGQGWG